MSILVSITITRAITAFKMGRFNNMLDALHSFTEQLEDVTFLDVELYANLWDGLWMLEVFWEEVFVLEKNAFISKIIEELKALLEQYKGEKEREINTDFDKYRNSWKLLLDDTSKLWQLAQRLGLSAEDNYISLAIGADQKVCLYVWHSEEMDEERVHIIEALTQAFESCFEEDAQQEVAALLMDARQATGNEDWQLACAKWQKLLQQKLSPEQNREVFYGLGEAYFYSDQWEEALDIFMKSILVGVPKEKVKPMASQAARYLLMYSESPKEEKHWRKFLNNFK